jgi:hypothetical protein
VRYLRRTKVAELKKNNYEIVGFGAGVLGLKTIRYLDQPFDYFIDNSMEKVKNGWKEYTDEDVNVRIVHFSKFKPAENQKIAVIICSEYFEVMSSQLLEVHPGLEMFHTPLLKNFEVFSNLINCSENILVSAYGGSGGLYLLNGKTSESRLLKSGSFRGTTAYKNKVYVANEQGDIFKINSFSDFSMDRVFKQKNRTNTHGILYWDEMGLLFITETLNDCISVYEMEKFKKVDEIAISYKSKEKGGNHHHINDLCIYKDKLYLSVISRSGNFYNDFLDGVIFELDYLKKEKPNPILTNLLFPHAIQVYKDKLTLLNSFNGDVLTISNQTLFNLPGFIRGMDNKDGLLYIGQSRHRNLENSLEYFNGVSMDSGVYIVDPQTKTHRFIHMPEMCDIFNIRILD